MNFIRWHWRHHFFERYKQKTLVHLQLDFTQLPLRATGLTEMHPPGSPGTKNVINVHQSLSACTIYLH